jgi:hypothetical protein
MKWARNRFINSHRRNFMVLILELVAHSYFILHHYLLPHSFHSHLPLLITHHSYSLFTLKIGWGVCYFQKFLLSIDPFFLLYFDS